LSLRDHLPFGLGRRSPPSEPYAYPLDRTQERDFSAGYEGDVHIWDIDKTYLATEFDSLKDLLAIPLETALDKRNVAGTATLLRALRRGRREEGAPMRSNPLYFVSASPPQLRSVLQKKMLLDGVEYDGITFKDQMALVRAGRLGKLKDHVGYKLAALLLNRRDVPWTTRETCFGDDTESDALVYALYADVAAGRLRGETLARTLRKQGADEDDAGYCAGLAEALPAEDLVHRIYVHLARRTSPASFLAYGPRVVPCWDTFQMALHLYEDQKIDREATLDVGRELCATFHRQPLGLLRSAFDLLDRGTLSFATLQDLWPDLQRRHLVPPYVALDESAAATLPTPAEPPHDFVTPAAMLDLAPRS
jgi:hypothetical protein